MICLCRLRRQCWQWQVRACTKRERDLQSQTAGSAILHASSHSRRIYFLLSLLKGEALVPGPKLHCLFHSRMASNAERDGTHIWTQQFGNYHSRWKKMACCCQSMLSLVIAGQRSPRASRAGVRTSTICAAVTVLFQDGAQCSESVECPPQGSGGEQRHV